MPQDPPKNVAVTDHRQVLRILGECCSHSTPTSLLGADLGQHWHARFSTVLDRELILDLLGNGPKGTDPQFVSVGFTHFDRAHFFVTYIRQIVPAHESQKLPQLLLNIPAQIAPVECRNNFRVPVLPGAKLQVQLTTEEGVVYRPRPIDISSSGICLEFDRGACPDLISGALAEMEIRNETRTVRLVGCMRHRVDRQFGFSFPQLLRQGELEPSGSLFEIVRSTELDWLRRRVSQA